MCLCECVHAPASLRAGRARWQGGICRGAGVAPGPSLRSRARSRTHVLLIKSSAGSSGSRSPGPRQALVTPGARARLQGCLPSSEIKLPLSQHGGHEGGGIKRERAREARREFCSPSLGKSWPRFPPCPAPHPPHLLTLPTSSSAPSHPPPAPPCFPWLRQGLLRAPPGPPPPALPQGYPSSDPTLLHLAHRGEISPPPSPQR